MDPMILSSAGVSYLHEIIWKIIWKFFCNLYSQDEKYILILRVMIDTLYYREVRLSQPLLYRYKDIVKYEMN